MKNQKGVALIIVFFIMTFIIAMFLGVVGSLLPAKVRLASDIGSFPMAFYAADSGAKKVLFHDANLKPPNGVRGFCYMGATCQAGVGFDKCNNLAMTGADCDPLTCTDCAISFDAIADDGLSKHTVNANVSCSGSGFLAINIRSIGEDISKNIARLIEIDGMVNSPNPGIFACITQI